MRWKWLLSAVLNASCILADYSAGNAQNRDRLTRKADSLVRILPAQKEDSLKVDNIMSISTAKMDIAQHTGHWEDAIAWTHKARDLAIKINYKWSIGRCTWQLGICWMRKGNYPEAIRFFTEGKRLSTKNGNPRLALACNLFMAECYSSLADYQEVLRVYQSSIDIRDQVIASGGKIDDPGLEHLAMFAGNAFTNLSNYDEAIKLYEKLLVKHVKVSEDQIRFSMANAQLGQKNYDAALKNLLRALEIFTAEASRSKRPETEFNGHVGNLYLKIGETYYAIASMRDKEDKKQLYKEALNYLDKSLPLLAQGAGGKESLLRVYEMLKRASEETNDYPNALRYTNLYMDLKDSMYSKASYVKMADLRIAYETEKAAALLDAKAALDKVRNEKLLADQKWEQEKRFAEERLAADKAFAIKELEQENARAEEKAIVERIILEATARQEKLRLEKQQTKNLLLISLGFVLVSSLFIILYIRQRNQKKRAVEQARAVHHMAELELQSLRSQLNPHFMFNSLNSIQAMILKKDTENSAFYLSSFARLVRRLLENASKPFITLAEEVDFLKLYIGLESLRIPDLQYRFDLDPGLDKDNILIPSMFLQPYVENAIWHGLSHRSTNKQLDITIRRENGCVNYIIKDNGIGRKKSGELNNDYRKPHQSMGMDLLNKRMNLLNKEYSSSIQTEISDIMDDNEIAGTQVSIKIPVNISK